MSQRERYIGIGVIAALGILALDSLLLTPYTRRSEAVTIAERSAKQKLQEAELTFYKQKSLKKKWATIRPGLKTDRSQAESQAQKAVLDWADAAGVNVASLKNDRDVTADGFRVISFNVTATGTMAQLSKLLWGIETASIPIRVNSLDLSPRRENTDDLRLELNVSTISQIPEPTTPRQSVTMVGGGR